MFFTKSVTSKSTFFVITLFMAMSISVKAENATFNKVCKECHTGGFKGWVSGAPNIKEKSDWEEYIERDTIEQMKEVVLLGTDNHKVKGGCKKCSDEEILGAVDYVLSNVK